MSLSTHLNRSLFALPLLALGVAAALLPPPSLEDTVRAAVEAGLDCGEAVQPAGALGLARMPGDLGLIGRRITCAAG
ncbi:hypothetical protein [Arenimonas sp.]|uniref:hypothetical protein n=1 Tax=Arenimonas sp. TaxID=1872635 RepID=UPI0035B0442E